MLRKVLPVLLSTLVGVCVWSGCGPSEAAIADAIEERIAADEVPPLSEGVQDRISVEQVRALYTARNFAPVWVESQGRGDRVDRLIALFCRAEEEGLWPATYASDAVVDALQNVESGAGESGERSDQLARLDLLLTRAYMTYASDLLTGRIDPREVGAGWNAPLHEVDLPELLASEEGAEVSLDLHERISDRHPAFGQLRDALQSYRQIAARGGWGSVDPGDALEAGSSSERVLQLRRRLIASGDLSPDSAAPDSARFDEALGGAVARFQQRHGLEPDSVAGDAVIEALNVPVENRIRQIELNLERWRWIPANLGSRYVYVNIPAFELHAFEEGQEVLGMRVVVGQEYDDQATPVFSDTMQYVVFSPYWNVPESIAADEIVPEARENPGYLARNEYEVVRGWNASEAIANPSPSDLDRVESGDYRIRQRPGPQNALGNVKFMFPNQFNIYLHDTPAEHLFERAERAYSHGCIRVEEPVRLAEFVLEGSGLSEAEIRERMEAGEEQTVNLQNPLPVYILYWTAFVDDGVVNFRKDLYGQDAALESALAKVRPAGGGSEACSAVNDAAGNRGG